MPLITRKIEGGRLQPTIDANFEGVALTTDGEVWTTATERENNVWSHYIGAFNSDTYIILASRLNANFPHRKQSQVTDRLDVSIIKYSLDLAANTEATISFGMISRINGVNADIDYFLSIPFLAGANKVVIAEFQNYAPSQIKLDANGGTLPHGITNNTENNVAAINTGASLASPAGNITPGLGDVIMKYDHTGGSANVSVTLLYHGN